MTKEELLNKIENPEIREIVGELIEENRQLETRIQQLEKDQLTQLYNRHKLPDFVEANCSVVLCDIDNFKRVNDKCGHDVGDAVLKTLSGVFMDYLFLRDKFEQLKPTEASYKEKGTPYRMGGDEFLLVLENCPLEEAKEKCALIRDEFLRRCKESPNISVDDIGLTMGFAYSETRESMEQITKRADVEMYKEKSTKGVART